MLVTQRFSPLPETESTRARSADGGALSDFRRRKLLRRAQTAANTDPHLALRTVHELQDKGDQSAETFELEASLLLALGCGTFAARATENAIQAGGDRTSLMVFLLKCHLMAFNRKPASRVIDALLTLQDTDDETKAEIAHGAQEIHRYNVARDLYAEVLERAPDTVKNLINSGYAEQKNGNMAQAEIHYREAIARKPDCSNAVRLLASVRKQSPDHNCLNEIEMAISLCDPETEDYAAAAYALGKTYEDLKDFNRAFSGYEAGAAAMRPLMPYSTDAVRSAFTATRDYFRHPAHTARAERWRTMFVSQTQTSPQPLFILGMPRTGSTLLDRMTSSHSGVVSMGELGCFKESMKVLTGFGGGEGFHEHFYAQPERDIDLEALGRSYHTAASPEGYAGRWYIDKYPMNFMDLGLIAAALPGAKFIHTIRNPMDTIFGNFKQLFTLGFYHYSYDLQECAEYFVEYRKMMAFWRELLPGRILDVHYACVVSDARSEVARVLDFLGLKWEEACLEFHRSNAPVDTASLSQVRQPIYKSALGHWENYGQRLHAAISVLRANDINPYESGADAR